MLERYLALGRDAYSAGDPITAESYYQHAEHYYRMSHAFDSDEDRSRRSNGDASSSTTESAPEAASETTSAEPTSAEPSEEDVPAAPAA